MSAQAQSPFFKLPFELREKIYKHYLDAEMKSGTIWTMSHHYMLNLATSRFMASQLPGLASTCKKIYIEFAPFAIGTFYIWVPRNTEWCFRVGMGGFNKKDGELCEASGPLRLSNMQKCTIRVDEPGSLETWSEFLGRVLSDEQAGVDVDPDVVDQPRRGQGPATELKEIVIDWSPLVQPLEGESDEDEKMFLDQVAGVETLEIVRLRSNSPAWFAGYLKEKRPTVRIIHE